MKKTILPSVLFATLAFGEANLLLVENRTFEQSKFIPDISLVMDASYVSRSVNDDETPHLEIPGVVHGLLGSHSHAEDSHLTNNAYNGFNLNYAELALSSSVDPFFSMEGIFHYSQYGTKIDELFFTSTALGSGLKLKGGQFNSNFGYLNEQHHHSYNFADMPLVYESFLGMHGINEKGIQLQWIAPTNRYLMVGVEILQGENENMFGYSSIHLDDLNSTNPTIDGEDAPSLYVGYIKTSFDIEDTTVLAGISYATGSSRADYSQDEEDAYAFSGDSTLYGVDLVVKHYFDSYSFLILQTELLSRDIEGTLYTIDENTKVATPQSLTKEQSGLYTQLIYGYDKNWKIGLRYDTIYKNEVVKNSINQNEATNLNKYSAMVEYNTSEFAKFRLQYNRNDALYNENGEQQKIDTIIMQVNISIGAHAAHSF